ncbi:MAG: single-stranded-DNA-specific exonuclease RecJ [Nitrospirae bacterium]|nr:single-stranded-DNA-specific exonuclease RecJ [Nitrospirota bacterium]MCL5421055.1 single-stranded-DNA-specific exonuclease RecJ [Nitrospirota bacterium]
MNRRWLIKRTNPEYILYLSKAASISPVLAQVLINRGIKTPGEVKDFLSPGITNLSDPFELPDMSAAVERIKAAFHRSERVLVHGDYDTDGLTATSIMVHALKAMGMDVHYFIPNRMTHGYGFNMPAVDVAKKLGTRLIITVDCGITSFEAAAAAKEKGMDVIITDHHEPALRQESGVRSQEFLLPDAVAVVNPKISNLKSQISNLSGAGIAFKVVQALAMDDALPFSGDDSLSLLDLAALGTLADVASLTGENRIILREGMRHIQNAHRRGIKSLIEVSGLRDRELRAGLLSFTLVPRINASGRIGDAGDVISLFLSDSDEETLSIAEKLDRTNSERQRIEEETYQEALAQLREKGHDTAVVLAGKGWHAGVIGIVASRIAEECYRPTFIFTLDNGIAKGSARSIPAFDLYNGLSACSDLLLSFGGHRQAAGLKLKESDIARFEEKMNAVARDALHADDFTPTIEIDTEVALYDVNTGLVRELSLLEPLGSGNPEPLLGARRLDVLNPKVVGKNHLKMRLKQKALSFDAIGFDMGNFIEHLSSSISVDAAFTPTINEWNGNKYLQLNLKACRPSS